MGWDTQIIIIAQGIEAKETAVRIAEQIFEKDSKGYGKESVFIVNHPDLALYFTYERRKYAPYWVIREISNQYPEVIFTLLGSSPEFIGGPGGIIRIKNGAIIDSYGIYGENSIRLEVLESPVENMDSIYEWYKSNGPEQAYRTRFTSEFPLGWCEENFSEKIIPIEENGLRSQIERDEQQEVNKQLVQKRYSPLQIRKTS